MNQVTDITRPYNSAELRLQQAIEGFKLSRRYKGLPEATEDELAEFQAKVRKSIISTLTCNLEIKEKADAEFNKNMARLEAVEMQAEKLGVKFFHRREKELSEEVIGVKSSIPISRTVNVENQIVRITETKARKGGETFAFMYKLNDKNDLSIIYSVAFCRSDEDFNPIIGMEESLKKFVAGKVVEMNISHDHLGDPKMIAMGKEFKRLSDQK